MLRSIPFSCVLIFVVASHATAGFMAFTDRTAFLNAAANAGLTTTSNTFTSDPGDPFTIADLNGNGVEFDILGSGFYSGAFEGIASLGQNPVLLESTSVTGTVVGVGFNISYQSNGAGVLQSVTLNSGAATTTNGGQNISFLGLLSTDGMTIASVDEIRLNESLNNNAVLTNLDVVTGIASPVPEPTSLALLGLSGLCVAGYRWRQRRKTKLVD